MIKHNNQSNMQFPAVWLPRSVEDAVGQMNRFGPEARFISGGTLLQIQWENGHRLPKHLISLELIPSLKEVQLIEEENLLIIGALTPLVQCHKHPVISKLLPLMAEAVRFIAAPAVRTRGTIGGNIMGGIGDIIPLLVAMKAKLVLITSNGEKKIDIWEWIKEGESYKHALLSQIEIPVMNESSDKKAFFKKIGRRESFTAAIVTVSGMLKITDLGTVRAVRLAAGGGENKPVLLEKTEELLKGKKTEEIDWKAVYHAICDEFIPVTDPFVTAEYRKKVAANLIIAELKSRLSSYEVMGGGKRDEV